MLDLSIIYHWGTSNCLIFNYAVFVLYLHDVCGNVLLQINNYSYNSHPIKNLSQADLHLCWSSFEPGFCFASRRPTLSPKWLKSWEQHARVYACVRRSRQNSILKIGAWPGWGNEKCIHNFRWRKWKEKKLLASWLIVSFSNNKCSMRNLKKKLSPKHAVTLRHYNDHCGTLFEYRKIPCFLSYDVLLVLGSSNQCFSKLYLLRNS